MIKMFDPTIDYKLHKNEYDSAIQSVLDSGMFIMGPEIKLLEEKLANFCHVKYAITVSNGTDALMIALMALDIGPGDEVITVPFTWISSAEVICILGAIPVFVDIDPKTYNMDVSKLENKITSKTKAIIPVSLYGQMADLEEINKIAEKYGIPVVEDGAQSFGSEQNGHKSCSCFYNSNKISCTSFFPSKPLGCYGDGGCCFTNDDFLATKIKSIRTHGGVERFKHNYVGTNGRLNTIQAAILLVKLKYFEDGLGKRINNAAKYNKLLSKNVIVPYVLSKNKHIYGQYTINVGKDKRDGLIQHLKENGIQASIFYPVAIHLQNVFKKYGYKKGDFPISEKICEEILSIPCFPELSDNDVNKVIKSINNFLE